MNNLKKLVDESYKIVFLTGAGVSTNSGLPDFKSLDENWGFDIPRDQVFSSSFFAKNPLKFWKIYRQLFGKFDANKPNEFHNFVAELEKTHDITVLTQNVDGLHTKAGSTHVVELHGTNAQLKCSKKQCASVYDAKNFENENAPRCPKCRKFLRPNIVLFGEAIKSSDYSLPDDADLMIVAGTSLNVTPANLLPLQAKEHAIKLLWVGLDDPPDEYDFDDTYVGNTTDFIKLMRE